MRSVFSDEQIFLPKNAGMQWDCQDNVKYSYVVKKLALSYSKAEHYLIECLILYLHCNIGKGISSWRYSLILWLY